MAHRFWLTICFLPSAVAAVAAGLIVWNMPTRDERAIATLIMAAAEVRLLDSPDGSRYFSIDLQRCSNNDEPLTYVPHVPNVGSLYLKPAPLEDAGTASLLRVRGLRYLDVTRAIASNEQFARLGDALKHTNPGLIIRDDIRESVPLNFDKK